MGGGPRCCACALDRLLQLLCSSFSQCPFLFPSPHLLSEDDLKGKIQSTAWKPFVGGDRHGFEEMILPFCRNSDVMKDFFYVRVYIKASLCLRRGRGEEGWGVSAWSIMWFSYNPKHERGGPAQMLVRTTSVVFSENRFCLGKNISMK